MPVLLHVSVLRWCTGGEGQGGDQATAKNKCRGSGSGNDRSGDGACLAKGTECQFCCKFARFASVPGVRGKVVTRLQQRTSAGAVGHGTTGLGMVNAWLRAQNVGSATSLLASLVYQG